MLITAVTIGSTGDVRPFIALGKELKKRGHVLTIATFPRFKIWIEKQGFIFAPIHGDEDLMMKLLIGDGVNGVAYMNGLSILLAKNKDETLNDVYNACRSADLILYTLLGSLAYHVAEALKIPCMRVLFCPFDKTGETPVPGTPVWPLGPWYNRLTYTLTDRGFSFFTTKELNGWRNKLGLNKWRGHSYHRMSGQQIDTLYAYSKFLAPKPREWGEHLHITGFWMLEEDMELPENNGLKHFLAGGDTPIYIGFGSMVGGSFEEMGRIVLKSLERTGQRAILSSGWRKLYNDPLPSNIYCVDYLPHEWLFKHVKAVVHHGGAGTTAAGLCAGRPTLTIPFGGDQPYWGERVYLTGTGPKPIPRKQLSVERLTEGLKQLENERFQKNAKKMSKLFSEEDACGHACDIIDRKS